MVSTETMVRKIEVRSGVRTEKAISERLARLVPHWLVARLVRKHPILEALASRPLGSQKWICC